MFDIIFYQMLTILVVGHYSAVLITTLNSFGTFPNLSVFSVTEIGQMGSFENWVIWPIEVLDCLGPCLTLSHVDQL